MKNIILIICVILPFLLFTNCSKENFDPEPVKQYLFDGLPYYLNDTLFAEEMLPDEMYALPYIVKFDSKGIAWILDTFGQLYRYDRWKKELINWNSTKILGTDPPYNIRDIFIDSKDRIWGTQYNELYLIDGTSFRRMGFGDKEDGPIGLSEDINGNIHFCGYNDGKEYICDGKSIVRKDPVFASDDYHIYQIASDNERNLWYFIDQTPFLQDDQGMFVVKYHDSTDFTMIPEQQNYCLDELTVASNVVFDRKGTPYFYADGELSHINSNNEWETIYKRVISDRFFPNELFIDHEDQIWAALGNCSDGCSLIGIVQDGQWIGESDNMATINDRNSVNYISFPDENTVWVCTSNLLYEFKKE